MLCVLCMLCMLCKLRMCGGSGGMLFVCRRCTKSRSGAGSQVMTRRGRFPRDLKLLCVGWDMVTADGKRTVSRVSKSMYTAMISRHRPHAINDKTKKKGWDLVGAGCDHARPPACRVEYRDQ